MAMVTRAPLWMPYSNRTPMVAFRRNHLDVYRCERGSYVIEMKLREVRQLFDTLDPSPFHEKDLDAAAEEYLVSAARELGRGTPANSCFMFQQVPAAMHALRSPQPCATTSRIELGIQVSNSACC